MKATVLTMQKAFNQLAGSLGGQPVTAPDEPQLVVPAPVAVAILDLARNLALGHLFPARAVARILGEAPSLAMLLPQIQGQRQIF
ncbi:hypothetical protein [Thermofilum pendens]